MNRTRRSVLTVLAALALGAALAPAAAADPPGPGSKPQCAGGPSNNNPHCPQNR